VVYKNCFHPPVNSAVEVGDPVIFVLHVSNFVVQYKAGHVIRQVMRFKCFKIEVSRLQMQSVLKCRFIYRINFGGCTNRPSGYTHMPVPPTVSRGQ
jgi:hypothetical protein